MGALLAISLAKARREDKDAKGRKEEGKATLPFGT